MKKIKLSVIIVVIISIVYCIVSYSIFFIRKASIDEQIQHVDIVQDNRADQVAIQSISQHVCQHGEDCYDLSDRSTDELQGDEHDAQIIVTQEPEQPLALIMAEPQEEFFIDSDLPAVEDSSHIIESYSFMTMPVVDASIDLENQAVLDVLIGRDVDAFVKLILQSNNNIVSKEACRSCGMYAFFNRIKNHKPVTVEEIRILQKLLINLYNFVERMKHLSNTPIMQSEQYDALEDLHKSQSIKNDIKLKARLAVTTAALKKLQTIKYNK